jgi:hypothetical protein
MDSGEGKLSARETRAKQVEGRVTNGDGMAEQSLCKVGKGCRGESAEIPLLQRKD